MTRRRPWAATRRAGRSWKQWAISCSSSTPPATTGTAAESATDTAWTPDIATQAANGTLGDTPGPVVAAHALGANLLVYKQRATYLATYLGPPVIWSFQLLADDAGRDLRRSGGAVWRNSGRNGI